MDGQKCEGCPAVLYCEEQAQFAEAAARRIESANLHGPEIARVEREKLLRLPGLLDSSPEKRQEIEKKFSILDDLERSPSEGQRAARDDWLKKAEEIQAECEKGPRTKWFKAEEVVCRSRDRWARRTDFKFKR